MKNRPVTPWLRLAAAARRLPEGSGSLVSASSRDALDEAPVGFSTRVVAHARLLPGGGVFGGALFERLAARALGFACACAVAVTLWSGMPTRVEAGASAEATALADAYLDPVGSLLDEAVGT